LKTASIIASVAFAALAVVACGGSTKTVVETVTAATTSVPTTASVPTTTTSANAGPPDCTTVNPHAFVGKCTNNGVTLDLVNRGSTAHLKTMNARVVNVNTTQSVSNGPGFTANATGTFVIVTIAVTNTTSSPQTFDEGTSTSQGELEIVKNTYSVSFDAENGDDPRSFLTNNNAIQPGETRTGTIDFDVPTNAAQQVYRHGALVVANFGDDVGSAQTAAILKLFQS
jgi:hypothetical protein